MSFEPMNDLNRWDVEDIVENIIRERNTDVYDNVVLFMKLSIQEMQKDIAKSLKIQSILSILNNNKGMDEFKVSYIADSILTTVFLKHKGMQIIEDDVILIFFDDTDILINIKDIVSIEYDNTFKNNSKG